MPKTSLAYVLLSFMLAGSVYAQTAKITEVLAKRPVHLYGDVEASRSLGTAEPAVLRKEIPIDVQATDGDLIQVRLAGQTYWVQGDLFHIDYQIQIDCRVALDKTGSAGRIEGAMGRGAGSMDIPCARSQ